MKYTKKDLPLNFEIESCYNHKYVDLRDGGPLKLIYYTFDLDAGDHLLLSESDITKIGGYFEEGYFQSTVKSDLRDGVMKIDLFLMLSNSPKCPYKIIGVSSYVYNTTLYTRYHLMLKDDILIKPKTITL